MEITVEPRIEALSQRLADTSLTPRSGATPQPSDRGELDELERAAEEALTAWREIEDAESRHAQSFLLAMFVGRSAAILQAYGRPRGRALIRAANELNPEDVWHTYGKQHPEGYVRLYEAQDLMEAGQESKAKKIAKTLKAEMDGPGLDEALAELKKMERPMKGTPAMFTLNGIGTRLYGARDEGPDGTHVATLCFCFLFIPLLPLAAYRVFNHGNGSFRFVSRAPLSAFALWARRLLLGGLAAAIALGVGTSIYNTPDRVATRAFGAAEAEVAAHPDEAAKLWIEFAESEHANHRADLAQHAAERWLTLELAAIGNPLDNESAPRMRRTLGVLQRLHSARRPALTPVFERLLGASDLKPATEIALLEKARGPLARAAAPETRRALKQRLATLLEPTRPLDAFGIYVADVDQPGPRAEVIRLGAIAAKRWSLLGSRAQEVRAWLPQLGSQEELKPTQSLLTEALEAAAQAPEDADRQAILENKKLRAVRRYAEAHEGDDEVATRLAMLHLQNGETEAAEAVLLRGASPGWLSFDAQTMLARLWSMNGRSEAAEGLLETQVAVQLPRLRAAKQRYQQAIQTLESALEQRAQRGDGPLALNAAIQSENQERISAAFYAWMKEEMAKSTRIQDLAGDYRSASGVVTAAVDLGGLKLARANAAPEEEREAVLREAEEVFLSVAEESEGMPNYHLGLGQVYYRLEKREKGEAELKEVLDLDDANLTVGVITVYRQLGLLDKARALAKQEHAKRSGPERTNIVRVLAIMAEDLEEERRWLRSIGEKNDADLANLAQVDARLATREGNFPAAVRHLRRSYGLWKKQGDLSVAGLNNRALVMSQIYPLNGDLNALRTAAQDLGASVRMRPDNPIPSSNHAALELHLALAEFFAERLDLEHFPLDANEALLLVDALERTKDEGLRAFAHSEEAQRVLRLMQRARVLAPARPDNYEAEARFARITRDEPRLRALLAAARRSLSLERETSNLPHDKEIEHMERGVDHARKRLARAKGKTGRAAAQYILSKMLSSQAGLTQEAGPLDEATSLLEKAATAWPAVNTPLHRQWIELARALFAGFEDRPALRQRYRDEKWRGAPVAFLTKLADEGKQQAFLDAVRAHPGFERAIKVAESFEEPTYAAWLLAKLAGNEQLANQHAPALTNPMGVMVSELSVRIRPSEARVWRFRRYLADAEAAGLDLP